MFSGFRASSINVSAAASFTPRIASVIALAPAAPILSASPSTDFPISPVIYSDAANCENDVGKVRDAPNLGLVRMAEEISIGDGTFSAGRWVISSKSPPT